MDELTQLFLFNRPAKQPFAVSSDGGIIPWQRFVTDLAGMSRVIKDSPLERWALCFRDSYWFAVSFFAVAVAGRELILPSNLTSRDALAPIRQHFDALLTDLNIETDKPVFRPMDHKGSTCDGTFQLLDVKLTLFTSGSTNKASAIEKQIRDLATETRVLKDLFGRMMTGCRCYATVSHQHIYGLLFRVLLPTALGQPFADFALAYPDQIKRLSAGHHVLISSPAHLKRLEKDSSLEGYNAIFSSGGPLPYQAAQDCQAYLGTLPIEIFGSSETGGIGWRQQQAPNTPWSLFPGIAVEEGPEQRLRIKSPFMSQQSWYTTSDRVSLLENGQFHLKGRSDRIIKISEKRISLEDVEQSLGQIKQVEEAVAIPLERDGRLEVCAVVKLTKAGWGELQKFGKPAMTRAMRYTLAATIEPVGVPRRFRFIEKIPVNSQGKYVLTSLLELFE